MKGAKLSTAEAMRVLALWNAAEHSYMQIARLISSTCTRNQVAALINKQRVLLGEDTVRRARPAQTKHYTHQQHPLYKGKY